MKPFGKQFERKINISFSRILPLLFITLIIQCVNNKYMYMWNKQFSYMIDRYISSVFYIVDNDHMMINFVLSLSLSLSLRELISVLLEKWLFKLYLICARNKLCILICRKWLNYYNTLTMYMYIKLYFENICETLMEEKSINKNVMNKGCCDDNNQHWRCKIRRYYILKSDLYDSWKRLSKSNEKKMNCIY